MAEHLSIAYAEPTHIEPVIARCFAFVGPHLPLDAHFAIGNFIRDAMAGRAIEIQGDGSPLRSYLYMSDLAAWLWTMLVRGAAGRAYNVGSDEAVSIRGLAERVADALRPGLPIRVGREAEPGAETVTYVPDISRARSELGLAVTVGLEEAIRRTAQWYFEGN
jgi:dTDP-glucose 4,6-dehydratase